MADAPPMPTLAQLLSDAQPCYCQPGTAGAIAIPDAGTYLVQDGRMALLPEPELDVPGAGFIEQTVRDLYAYAARTLADAAPGTRLEVKVSADGPHQARVLGTYVFERPLQEADHG